MAQAIQTLKIKLIRRPECEPWFYNTKMLFNQVVAFYFNVIQAHQGLLDLTNQEALTALEALTHKTKLNVEPLMPLSEIATHIPAMFRRGAINTAIGAAQSFFSNLAKWKNKKAKSKKLYAKPPVPPREFNFNPKFYKGQYKDLSNNSVMLNLYDGKTWRWVKYRFPIISWDESWKPMSPTLVIKKQIEMHLPLQKKFQSPDKGEKQFKAGARICSVDLNINDSLAVCTILNSDGTVAATRFIRGGKKLHDRRKRLLGRVAVQRSKTGTLEPHVQDNKALWRHIQNIDRNETHRVSRRIVDFAIQNGATIIVFECLKSYRPMKGKYSRRSNAKRSYWLRGKIQKYTKYKAWAKSIITCLVSPRNTSRDCHVCGSKVARYDANSLAEGYQEGAPLFSCMCGQRGNADFNAAVNVGIRLQNRYRKPDTNIIGGSVLQDAAGHEDRFGPALPEVSGAHYESKSSSLREQCPASA